MQVDRICKCCKQPFKARSADVKRGWARFCSKSCKATKQERRTHQFRDFLQGGAVTDSRSQHERDMDDAIPFGSDQDFA